jgi:hypothetical protein
MEQAVAELKKALHFKSVVVPYVCTACRQNRPNGRALLPLWT